MGIRQNRIEWKRKKVEMNGKISYKDRQEYTRLLCDSYYEVQTFLNCCRFRPNCPTHASRAAGGIRDFEELSINDLFYKGICAVDFDSQAIHLAAGTRSGCLTLLKFDQMYSSVYGPNPGLHHELCHICSNMSIEVLRWCPTNENVVCCGSCFDDKIRFYDVNIEGDQPIRMLEKGVIENTILRGLTDILFSSSCGSRLLASGIGGAYLWDMRLGNLPCLRFSTGWGDLQSIETDAEERVKNIIL